MAEASTPTGKFVWYEYMGDDLKAAADFYTGVVGWSAKDGGMADFPYQIVSTGPTMVAGMMNIPSEAKSMGARPSWLGYIWVEDVDKALPRLTEAGGKVFKPPADIPGVGRFAVVADPDGAAFMLFRDAGGNPPPGAPGLVGWHELSAGDAARALSFYVGQFGWKKASEFDMAPMGVYHLFDTGHGQQGGMFTKTPDTPAPFWLYYFNVDSIDAAAERIKARGGRITNGPMQVPNGPWIVSGRSPRRDVRAARRAALSQRPRPKRAPGVCRWESIPAA
jgi:predicted enzyme related to lactoylglutathione lyase